MYNDFLQIKSLDGELKFSHKKKNFGITVSTMELVYHKPHVNYIVRLEDIISIVPYDQHHFIGENRYRIYVKAVTAHNRSGIFHLGPTELILPLLSKLVKMIGQYGQMDAF